MIDYIRLETIDLVLAGLLLLINGGLSLALRLGIETRLAIAAARMVVQLLAVGLVLKALFASASPWLTALAALAMILVAGREIVARQDRRLAGWWSYGLGVGSMAFAAVIVTLFALTTQIQADPWYDPRFALPILGMVLGNTMTGIALGLDTLTTAVTRDRASIEAQLALGATRFVALRQASRTALRSALMPMVNAMAAAGLVSLPGMMTGQILSGVDPVEATKYQILIMFLIAGGTAFGAVIAVQAAVYRLSDGRHRLRTDRLTAVE